MENPLFPKPLFVCDGSWFCEAARKGEALLAAAPNEVACPNAVPDGAGLSPKAEGSGSVDCIKAEGCAGWPNEG